MIARVEHAFLFWLLTTTPDSDFIFAMIFVSCGGVYIHVAGNIRQIWAQKFNTENKSSLFGLHVQQFFVWPLGGTAVNDSTNYNRDLSSAAIS